ncbi:MAG: glycosyltransferase [Lentisphaeria bacterium]|nr:glycosyltransferase [Lentisphaeria bacterium]NQZ69776.1 glycosyltransferase [Lentisphaeria bacterium]
MSDKPNLTVVLPTMREAGNLPWLFKRLHEELDDKVNKLEILVVDTPTGDGTEELCKEHGARYIGDPSMGFADALKRGFKEATHELIQTMDADGSHDPSYIRWFLDEIETCDLVIASRYVPRGGQETTFFRYITSRILNIWVGTVCSMKVLDLSGGFKLYKKEIFDVIDLESSGFEIQCEIAITIYGHGFKIREAPFCYHPRMEGRSKAAIIKYGLAFLFGSLRLRKYRNSRAYCDYDERAYKSRWPFQRIWQRKRYAIIKDLLKPEGKCLDIGCGSGPLVISNNNVTGLDNNPNIIRYLNNEERNAVLGNADMLEFKDKEYDNVYCCEVAEYMPKDTLFFEEAVRVLKPGGKLLVTTPDYGKIFWPLIKRIYKLFVSDKAAHDHVSHYDEKTIKENFEKHGLNVLKTKRMFGAILFVLFEKPVE